MMGPDLGPLASGSTAVVIGGGPSGVAAAIALKQGARALGRDVRVIVVEGKRFAGEQHHNQCAGVLSPPIATVIENELGLPFPRHLSRNTIDEYVLHSRRRSIHLRGEAEPSLSVRRVQFDAYMLEAARERGVEIVNARALDLERREGGVTVYTESGPLEADVVVGAFGVDDGSCAFFARASAYRPPPTLGTLVMKCHPGEYVMGELEHSIHAFLPTSLSIEFGAITPKGNHLTFIVAGAQVDSSLMERFVALP
jgi:2-polyprenyl-6-methoxyphenol hydroxylase-like FAD-dependent oxidoreductase